MPKVDITVQELVNKVRRGELLLPEMQRRYVWPATRVRDLLDSLYRGYPSGTVLVWETDDNIATRELATGASDTPSVSTKQLLLDGQQRITSLTAILSGEPVNVRGRKRPIDILFNLEHPEGPPTDALEVDEPDYSEDVEETEDEETAERDIQEELRKRTFVVGNRPLRNNPVWVPVSEIFAKRDTEILRPIGINSDDSRWDKYTDRLNRVRKIASYQYVMHVLEKDLSYEEVTEIFVRVNSLGIKLRGSDLALAQISSKWRGFMDILDEFAESIDGNGDYIVESGLAVRMLVVFATHQSRFKTVGKLSPEQLQEAWLKAKEAIQFSVNFLRSNASIDQLPLLASPLLLIPLGVYSVLKGGNLSPEEEKMLLRWLYVAHMRGYYSGSSESILDADLSLLFKGKGLQDLLEQLFLKVKTWTLDVGDVVGRSIRSPVFSMLYFVFKQQGAKDWLSGLRLSEVHVGNAHKIQYHHIFPKSLLKEAGYGKKETNEIANMAFIGGKTNRHILNKEPTEYFSKEIIPKRGEEALTSQLVPTDRSLWEMKSYPAFLSYRAQKIAETINTFLRQFE